MLSLLKNAEKENKDKNEKKNEEHESEVVMDKTKADVET